MKIIASIEWPGGEEVTKVWARQRDGRVAYWSGPEEDFTAADVEMEEEEDYLDRPGLDLVCLHSELLAHHSDYMADTDRNLLAEIDALLDKVRAAQAS